MRPQGRREAHTGCFRVTPGTSAPLQGRGTHLGLPDGVHGVAHDLGSPLLPMVGEGREDAVFPRLNGNLQVRIWVEEHPFL